MLNLATIFAALPAWVLPVGWLALLLGWVLSRPATQRVWNKVVVIGIANTTNNRVNVYEASSPPSGDSALSKVGSWCSVVGLLLTLPSLLGK